MSTSSFISSPFLKALIWVEEINFLALFKPVDQTIFAFNASLGSARSTMIALREYIPTPVDVFNSDFL